MVVALSLELSMNFLHQVLPHHIQLFAPGWPCLPQASITAAISRPHWNRIQQAIQVWTCLHPKTETRPAQFPWVYWLCFHCPVQRGNKPSLTNGTMSREPSELSCNINTSAKANRYLSWQDIAVAKVHQLPFPPSSNRKWLPVFQTHLPPAQRYYSPSAVVKTVC